MLTIIEEEQELDNGKEQLRKQITQVKDKINTCRNGLLNEINQNVSKSNQS